jgi:hypothetical protein
MSKSLGHEFQGDKYCRLKRNTDLSDTVIIYALFSLKKGEKGVLVNSYGIYADPFAREMLDKLFIKH